MIEKNSKASRDEIFEKLSEKNVILRKYFSKSLDLSLANEQEKCENSFTLSQNVLCLPIFPELQSKDAKDIANCILALTE